MMSEVVGLTWNDLKKHGNGGKVAVFGKGFKTRVIIVPNWLWARLKEFEKHHLVNSTLVVHFVGNQN